MEREFAVRMDAWMGMSEMQAIWKMHRWTQEDEMWDWKLTQQMTEMQLSLLERRRHWNGGPADGWR